MLRLKLIDVSKCAAVDIEGCPSGDLIAFSIQSDNHLVLMKQSHLLNHYTIFYLHSLSEISTRINN